MSNWSRYLFGASIFLGAGMLMLNGQQSEWWRIVSIIVMLIAACVFLFHSIVEYRRSRSASTTTPRE